MFWEVTALITLIIILFLGMKRKTSYMPEFIVGAIYGFWWEVSTETLFNYAGPSIYGFSIYIWKDLPLAMVLLWGVSIAGFALISDCLQEKIPLNNGKKYNLKNSLFWDIIVASGIGWTLEISGSQIFNMWSYPPEALANHIAVLNVPVIWLAGWSLAGIFLLGFARRYKKAFMFK